MKTKKLLLAILAGLTLFAFTGCEEGIKPAGSEAPTGAPTEPNATQAPVPDAELLAEGNTVNNGEVELKAGDTYTIISIKDFGEIKIKLFPKIAPVAVQNFIGLAEEGYYEGKIFHRIIPGFMAQGGSPNGDGMSTEYDFFSIEPSQYAEHFYGALAMANAGPTRNSQQFYIVNTPDGAHGLNGGYTVFGQTVEGIEVVDAISSVQRHGERPVEEVVIESVTIGIFEG